MIPQGVPVAAGTVAVMFDYLTWPGRRRYSSEYFAAMACWAERTHATSGAPHARGRGNGSSPSRIPRNIHTKILCQGSSSMEEIINRLIARNSDQPVIWLTQYICLRLNLISFEGCCPFKLSFKTGGIFFSLLIKYKLIGCQHKSVRRIPELDK